jgi:hypothetical protein
MHKRKECMVFYKDRTKSRGQQSSRVALTAIFKTLLSTFQFSVVFESPCCFLAPLFMLILEALHQWIYFCFLSTTCISSLLSYCSTTN